MRRSKKDKLLYYSRPHFYEKCLSELEEVEERVVWLLAKHDKARNSDMFLLMKYWLNVNKWNGLFIEPYIHLITNAETIIRKRRYIQNTLSLFLPTNPIVAEGRGIKEAAYRDHFSTPYRTMNDE